MGHSLIAHWIKFTDSYMQTKQLKAKSQSRFPSSLCVPRSTSLREFTIAGGSSLPAARRWITSGTWWMQGRYKNQFQDHTDRLSPAFSRFFKLCVLLRLRRWWRRRSASPRFLRPSRGWRKATPEERPWSRSSGIEETPRSHKNRFLHHHKTIMKSQISSFAYEISQVKSLTSLAFLFQLDSFTLS